MTRVTDDREQHIQIARDEILRFTDSPDGESVEMIDVLSYLWGKVDLMYGVKAFEELGFDKAEWQIVSSRFVFISGDVTITLNTDDVYDRYYNQWKLGRKV